MFHGPRMMPSHSSSSSSNRKFNTSAKSLMEDISLLDKSIALNQKQGSSVKQGRVFSNQKAQSEQIQTSAQISNTAAPKNSQETAQKMKANDVLPADERIVIATTPVVVNAIKQGASPAQASRAMKTEAAVAYTNCKDAIAAASQADQGRIGKLLGDPEAKQIKLLLLQYFTLEKEGRIYQESNQPDLVQKVMGQLEKVMTELGMLQGSLAIKGQNLSDPALYNCIIDTIKSEAQLEFEAVEGSAITSKEQLVADGLVAPEELIEEAEAGEILSQAAAEDVDSKEGLAVVTADSAAALQKTNFLNTLMKKNNLLIGALILGGLFLYMNRK